jgi:glycosyltransferase involved in cell wall biosynthesis
MSLKCRSLIYTDPRIIRFDRRVAVCIPAFNEAANIRAVIRACRAVRPALILVIDDASQDLTSRILSEEVGKPGAPLRVLRNEKNLGKQGSIRRGLMFLSGQDLDAVALIDGDGQHDPGELPRLAALLSDYDFIIGARSREEMPVQRRLSNWLVNLGFLLLGGVDFVDVQSGLRIYSRRLAGVLAARLPEQGGYALEHESLAILAEHARDTGSVIRAAAAPVSCRYGGKSSMQPHHILQLTFETFRQAQRLGEILQETAG